MSDTIGGKIKRIRELRKITQKRMAEKIGMSETGYSKIERNETDVPYSRLEQIATALNLKVDDIINFDEKYVFINYGEVKENQYGHIQVQNNYSDKTQQVYEDRLKFLEDKVRFLEEIMWKERGK